MRTAAGFAFLITLLLTPVVIWVLKRRKVYDVPSERSSHTGLIPRGGGIAVAIGAVAGMVIAAAAGSADAPSLTTLLATVSILAVVGLIDDFKTLDVFPRLGAQLAGALLAMYWALRNVDLSWGLRLLIGAAAVVWIMGFVNAFNFMDGINGISACTTIVAGATFVVIGQEEGLRLVTVCGGVIAAAALGFLPYNFPKARVFLGDVGSYFIGGWLAFAALVGWRSDVPFEAMLAPLVIYLADTSFTLARRLVRREAWHESHRQHSYQQLVDQGWSHGRTTLVVTAFTVVCSALGLVSLWGSTTARVLAAVGIVATASAYLALPRLLGGTRSTCADQPAAAPAAP